MGGSGSGSKAGSAPRRSEVKHSLAQIAPNGKLRDKVAVVKVLRLFNLCDIGTKSGELEGALATKGARAELTANQHARMADLSLLLDVVLKTTKAEVQANLIKFGILSQLQPIILRTLNEAFTVVMKKMMRVRAAAATWWLCFHPASASVPAREKERGRGGGERERKRALISMHL